MNKIKYIKTKFIFICVVLALSFPIIFTACSLEGDINMLRTKPGDNSGKPQVLDTPGLYRGAVKIGNHNLSESLSYISANAVTGDEFYIILGANESIFPANNLSYPGKTASITLLGYSSEKTITLSSNGSMFTVGSGVTLTLEENIKLVGRSANTASIVQVNLGGTFIMNGGAISGNTTDSSNYGGGVYNNGTFIMNNGTINGNTAKVGGGVNVNGTFIMNGGIISGNTTSDSGGGVCVNGTFIMNGGIITGNTVSISGSGSYGGGVYVRGGSFTMHSGTISGNTTTTSSGRSSGGGVYVDSGTTFTMNGGYINGNTVSGGISNNTGGGVYVLGIFIMNSGTISGNTAGHGGGVYVYEAFTMHGGTISGNIVSAAGGGVYVSGTFIKQPNGSSLYSGIIYGSETVENDANGVPLRNITSDTSSFAGGHTIYVLSGLSGQKRNTTAGLTDQIDSSTGRGLSANGEPPFGN